MQVGQVLHTRNGAQIGNAIVTHIKDHPKLGQVFQIRTDFGNETTLTQSELESQFTLGEVQDPRKRLIEQQRLIEELSRHQYLELMARSIIENSGAGSVG